MGAASEREPLATVARTLLDPEAGVAAWREASRALFALCCDRGGFSADPHAAVEPATPLAEGIALAPRAAAGCILDCLRTARFLRGVAAAIDAAGARFGAPVEVLYAGCGPFAPLFFPLAVALPTGRARFTLLDVHAPAIACVRRLAAAFGLEDWLRAAEVAEACAWRAPRPPHVIVAEVMQAGLAREPQVAVMRALAPQLAPGGFCVPEGITLTACLADLKDEFASADAAPPAFIERPSTPRQWAETSSTAEACATFSTDRAEGNRATHAKLTRVDLGDVLCLRADELRRGLPRDAEPPLDWPIGAATRTLPTVRVLVPHYAGPRRSVLLLTHVRIFGELSLAEGDSGLTVPQVIHALGRVAPGSTLDFRYGLGAAPGLDARVVG